MAPDDPEPKKNPNFQENDMNNINASPLEHLATNAITFVAGALVTLGLSAYIRYIKQEVAAQPEAAIKDTRPH